LDRAPFHPKPLKEFVRNLEAISAEMRTMADAISVTPISADLLRIRAVVEQRKPRLTLAEVSELERTHRVLGRKLADYRQSAFSLIDLHNAVRDAGYEMGEHGGDPAVCFAQFSDKRLIEQDRTDFIVDLAQACPRYAHSIMRAAQWSDGACCFWWCARELREAA
jgi:hypothetical protein